MNICYTEEQPGCDGAGRHRQGGRGCKNARGNEDSTPWTQEGTARLVTVPLLAELRRPRDTTTVGGSPCPTRV